MSKPLPNTPTKKPKNNHVKLKEFYTAVEQAGDSIFITDNNGFIQYTNPAFEKLTGFSNKEAIGNTPRIVKSNKQDKSYYQKLWTTILSGEIFRATLINKKKSGELFHADHTITPIKDKNGHVTNFVGIWKDITEYKELEARKDEFISLASHELKTPVTVIKAYADLLKKQLTKNQDEKNLYLLSKISASVRDLIVLINELLDVNRIDDGKMVLNKEIIDLKDLISKIVIDFQYANDSHYIQLVGDAQVQMRCDKERIGQVATNLITNAIKYSPKGSQIIVSVKSYKTKVEVKVQDQGIGIASSQFTKIFERFYRVGQHHPTGFGIGLYVCADIIKRHDGEIWVESEKGKGSIFCFTLPKK